MVRNDFKLFSKRNARGRCTHTVTFVLVRGAVVFPVDGIILRAHIAIQLKGKRLYIAHVAFEFVCECAGDHGISGEEKRN